MDSTVEQLTFFIFLFKLRKDVTFVVHFHIENGVIDIMMGRAKQSLKHMHILDVPRNTLENGRRGIFARLAVFGSGLEMSLIYGNEEQLRK